MINQQGVVRARALVERNGRIVLDGGDTGVTLVSGQLDASGRDAGADRRRGRGARPPRRPRRRRGAWMPAGMPAAARCWWAATCAARIRKCAMRRPPSSEADAAIHADALGTGAGGKVVVWSDKATRVHGTITANGGARGGDGGFVETSGAFLDVSGARVRLLSAGQGGRMAARSQ
ncbi:MAG: hypothetical protein MZV65_48255 [Chromatiales bacterium]|nr:hypothetical protein [Chromatiales bacterium]